MRIPPVGGSLPRDVVSGETGQRRALARCRVVMSPATVALVASNAVNKGDVLATARVAGIQAAKKAADLLPMSHLVLVGNTYINFAIGDSFIEVEASVDTNDRTGVEMEALTAASVAALTIYDMCKNADRTMSIENLALWEKTGGRAGSWRRDELTGGSEGPV